MAEGEPLDENGHEDDEEDEEDDVEDLGGRGESVGGGERREHDGDGAQTSVDVTAARRSPSAGG
jgi:hypothetical protein